MTEAYDQYVQQLSNRLRSLERGAGVAAMLSACERMFFVLSRPETRRAVDQSSLRALLDAMWEKKPVEGTQLLVPEEFEIESLSDELVLMATDSILMTREALQDRAVQPESILKLAVELANAVDAAQDPEGTSDAGSLDAFLREPASCAYIEAARQFEDLADIAAPGPRADAWANLRARATRQDITCGLPL